MKIPPFIKLMDHFAVAIVHERDPERRVELGA
jgi:hypothetical protein